MHTTRRTLLKALTSAGALAAPGGASLAATKIAPDAESALIVVDVPNCFVTGGTRPVAEGEAVVPVIDRLAAGFENVVLTQDWHTHGHASLARTCSGQKPSETVKLACDKDAHPEMGRSSAFEEAGHQTATGLAAYLKARGIKTLYITGLATESCVAWTAIDARQAGFDVCVIETATRAIDPNGLLAGAWKQMAAKGVKRIQSCDLA